MKDLQGGVVTVRRITIAAAVAIMCVVVFGMLWDAQHETEGISVWDGPVNSFIAARREPDLTIAFRLITMLGNTATLVLLVTAAALLLAWRARSWRPVWLPALAVGGSTLAVTIIKLAVGRPRPDHLLAAANAGGYSFPSGHATNSLVAFSTLALIASTTVATRRRARIVLWSAAIGAAVAIGLSRVYLGVHYVSDVLAGWTVAIGWLTVLIILDVLVRRGRLVLAREGTAG
jgi:membrane-associated phospholipid phosphatase